MTAHPIIFAVIAFFMGSTLGFFACAVWVAIMRDDR